MIEEQTGIEVIAEVDPEFAASFLDEMPRALVALPFVLAAILPAGHALATFDEDVLGGNREDRGGSFHHRIEPAFAGQLVVVTAQVAHHQPR